MSKIQLKQITSSTIELLALDLCKVIVDEMIVDEGEALITANLGQVFLFHVPYLIAIFLFTFAILKTFVANLLRNIANLRSQLKILTSC